MTHLLWHVLRPDHRARIASLIMTLCFTAYAAQTSAQPITATSSTNTATASYSIAAPNAQANNPINPLAITDETVPLGEALVRELRRGGYVLFVRHGLVQPGATDTRGAGEWWKNCATTQRLGSSALPQAQAIGASLRAQQIQFEDVLSSEFCRAYDTGIFIGFAAPIRTPALNDSTAFDSQKNTPAKQSQMLQNLLSSAPSPGKNRLLIGHSVAATAVHPILSILTETETAIFKPDGKNGFQFVTTLKPGQWQWLGKQTINGQASTAAAPQVVQPQAPPVAQPPVIDPARELKGAALITALRKGGYNLYMRHATSTVGSDQDLLKVPMWWENCAIQRNIADLGREQAKKVGNAIAELKLPISEIKTSQFCRVRDTAYAMNLGAIEITEALNHAIGQRVGTDVNALRFAMLATEPAKGTNILMISHTHGSQRPEERVMGQLQESEIVVYLPDGKGGSEPIARIPPTEWDNLISLTKTAKH